MEKEFLKHAIEPIRPWILRNTISNKRDFYCYCRIRTGKGLLPTTAIIENRHSNEAMIILPLRNDFSLFEICNNAIHTRVNGDFVGWYY